jgi:hypothetical protein
MENDIEIGIGRIFKSVSSFNQVFNNVYRDEIY